METHFYFTKTATVIPSVTGAISALSSAAIISIIVKSNDYSQYHRIMFFMSFWDLVTSLSIALTTIPMPKDLIYDIEGPTYGTTATCEAQAFLILTGIGFMICSNTFLTVFYLCTIKFQMEEKAFRKILEPVFLLFAICLSLVMPIQLLLQDALNPTPYEPYCSVGKYPINCKNDGCIRGGKTTSGLLKFLQWFFIISVSTQVGILVVSMLLIIHTSYVKDRELKEEALSKGQLGSESSTSTIDHEQLRSSRFTTKAITQQALMYILTCVLTWVFLAISFFEDNGNIGILKLSFQPMQGFFNMLIFIYHKINSVRNKNVRKKYTVCEALSIVLWRPSEVPGDRLSGMDLVHLDNDTDTRAGALEMEMRTHAHRYGDNLEIVEDGLKMNVWRLGGNLEDGADMNSCVQYSVVNSSNLSTGKRSSEEFVGLSDCIDILVGDPDENEVDTTTGSHDAVFPISL